MSYLPKAWIDSIARFAARIDLYNFGRWLVLATVIGVAAGPGTSRGSLDGLPGGR